MPMRGLTIVVAGADADRFHAALSLAAANAAIGGRTRVFLQGEAAALIHNQASVADLRRSGVGVPTTPELLGEARVLGVELFVCQSGLVLCGLAADRLPEGVATAGLVHLLASLDDDRLIMA